MRRLLRRRRHRPLLALMTPRSVFLRPRRVLRKYGTEWIPRGLQYRPFHLDHEEIPPAATDHRQFDCSPALDTYLIEFYHNIRPLLTIPSFDSAPLCVLYTNYLCVGETEQSEMVIGFRRRLMKDMVDWCRTLPVDVTEMLKLNLQLDNTHLAMQLMKAHIFSMQSELIELKVWVCLLIELVEFAGAFLISARCCDR